MPDTQIDKQKSYFNLKMEPNQKQKKYAFVLKVFVSVTLLTFRF
ncbi:WxL protein peptidoglycan domain-containing protein [Lysinibacillus xylanilyticus]